jgi:hypothetical protein
MTDLDFDVLFREDVPKEKLESYAKMIEKLPNNKPNKWELKYEEEKVFCKLLRKLNKVCESQRFKILNKFFNEMKGGGRAHHKKYMLAIDRAKWRIDFLIQDGKDYDSMMSAELNRILEKD